MREQDKGKRLTAIDLFSGCGGLSLGFLNAGYDILLGVDNDPIALDTFKRNHGETKILCSDISGNDIISEINSAIENRPIDVIIAGPPCQGFSLTGPRNQHDKRNRLVLILIRIAEKLQPKAFLIENVPGIATLYGGRVMEELMARFDRIGYYVSFDILCAADYGIPQMRKRAFFVGLKKEYGKFRFPKATHIPDNYITCSDAISDLSSREYELGKEEDVYDRPPETAYQRKMRTSCKVLYNHIATNHKSFVKWTIAFVPEGGNYKDLPPGLGESRRFNEAWTRYHSRKPSRTVDTGHRNHFHYKYNRVPTIRENARLQSFPDSFVFLGNRTQQNRQVGNAVPPLLGYHLARQLGKYLDRQSRKK